MTGAIQWIVGAICLLALLPSAHGYAEWAIGEWEPCTSACGGGNQHRVVACVSTLSQPIAESNCFRAKPSSDQPCNTTPCLPAEVVQLSCHEDTVASCPPGERQGGSVTFVAVAAHNLPNLDGPGGATDAYFRVRIGNVIQESSTISNNNNPRWAGPGEDVYFGVFDSRTPVTVELWNGNGGFLGSDELIGRATSYVIACNQYVADQCEQRTRMSFDGSSCYLNGDVNTPDPRARCMEFGFRVHSFRVALTFWTPGLPITLGVANYFEPVTPGQSVNQLARVYSDDDTTIDANYGLFKAAKGGVVVQVRAAQLDRDNDNTTYIGFKVDLDCTVFVFVLATDINDDGPIPWLSSMGFTTSSPQDKMQTGSSVIYLGYHKAYAAGSTIDLPGLAYRKSPANRLFHEQYVVVVRYTQDQSPPPAEPYTKFDRSAFASLFWQFVFGIGPLFVLSCMFIHKLRYRLDHIPVYLMSFSYPVDTNAEYVGILNRLDLQLPKRTNPHILQTLFLTYMHTPANRTWRRNMWYMTKAVQMVVWAPFVLLFVAGCIATATVRPKTLGLGIMFAVPAVLMLIYSVLLWLRNGGRIMPVVARMVGASVVLLLFYNFLAVFHDPAPFSLFSCTAAYLTLNMLGMVWIAFLKDPYLKKSFKQVAASLSKNKKIDVVRNKFKNMGTFGLRMAQAVAEQKEAAGDGTDAMYGDVEAASRAKAVAAMPWLKSTKTVSALAAHNAANPFKELVGDAYTIAPNVANGMFDYADGASSLLSGDAATMAKRIKYCYIFCFATLCVLTFSVWDNEPLYPNQGLAVLLSVCVLDSCMFLLWKGGVTWTPSYVCMIMLLTRVSIAVFVGKYWLVGHSVAYLVFGTAVVLEIIHRKLPRIDKDNAGALAYFGISLAQQKDLTDLSGSPGFVITYLSLFYLMLLLGYIFNQQSSSSSHFAKLVITGHNLPVWIFGVAAMCILAIAGLGFATIRAFYLDEKGLLHSDKHLYLRGFNVPYLLAACTEITVILSGLLMYGVTGSKFLVILAFFAPLLGVLFMRVATQWVKNDYELLEHPSLRPKLSLAKIAEMKAAAKDASKRAEQESARNSRGSATDEVSFVSPKGSKLAVGDPATAGLGPSGAANTAFRLPPLQKSASAKAPVVLKEPSPPGTIEDSEGKAEDADAAAASSKVPGNASPTTHSQAEGSGGDGDLKVVTEAGEGVGEEGEEGAVSKPAPPRPSATARLQVSVLAWADKYALWKPSVVDPVDMPPLQAFVKGHLTRSDYVTISCLISFIVLLFIMGQVISGVVSPAYLGQVMWVAVIILLTSIPPIIKYFHTYTITLSMYVSGIVSMLLHTFACAGFYGDVLHSTTTDRDGLWLFTIWLLYPALLTLGSAAFMWKDDGYFINKFIKWGTIVSMVPVVIWVIMVFGLNGPKAGGILFLLCVLIGLYFFGTYVWAENDFYVPHSFMVGVDGFLMFMAGLFIFIGLVSSVDIFWCFSIALFFVIIRQLGLAVQRWANRNPESVMFFSPFVFPMYSYNPETYDIVSENKFGFHVVSAIFLALLWGLFAIAFVKALAVGVGILSIVLIGSVQLAAYMISSTPLRLGQASLFADEWVLKQAGEHARAVFLRRREVFDVLCDEFVQRDKREEDMLAKADKFGQKKRAAEQAEKEKVQSSLLVRFTALELAEHIVKLEWDMTQAFPWETRVPSKKEEGKEGEGEGAAVPFRPFGIGDEADAVATEAPRAGDNGEMDAMVMDPNHPGNRPPSRWRAALASARTKLVAAYRKARPAAPQPGQYDPIRRHDAPYTLHDILEEIWYLGHGPMGWLSARGYMYIGWVRYKKLRAEQARRKKYESALEAEQTATAAKKAATAGGADGDGAGGTGIAPGDAGSPRGDVEEGGDGGGDDSKRSPAAASASPDARSPASPTSPTSPDSQGEDEIDALASPVKTEAVRTEPGLGVLEDLETGKPYLGDRRDLSGVFDNCFDYFKAYHELLDLYDELAREYYEENRVLVHLQLLVIVSSEARLRSEAVLFQKFLREYRFKLMANGVQPPENVFQTQSYASVDVQLVATWLLHLTPELRERFKSLKDRFSEEVEAQYYLRLQADQEAAAAAYQHLQSLKPHEQYMWQKRWQDFQRRRIARKKAGTDDPKIPEDDLNNQEIIREVEEKFEHCKPGEYGRDMQFHDPEFPPDQSSVGYIQRADLVSGWKVSKEINPNASLFADGTDPDDVFQGQLADGWLLSAISIVAASGGVGDDSVDPLVDNLFVTKETTSTGVYAVRLFKNAQWETVVVDDFFPVMEVEEGAPSAGAAFAYSGGFKELWVPIIEKAYAKYHGGYAALEFGYVHHALHDLTGGDAEEIFLAEASRGANKYLLWTNMMKYRENHYLMGAGTIMPNATDRELMDSGLVFGAAYVVYDVRYVDGHRLIKLRNPPGAHGEWKGDWGDKSPLWTRRMKLKLGWTDEDDGTFWMSFDDFCFAFRSLYLCRWFDPSKWYKDVHTGWWKGPTAEGLPSKHNLGCKLQNNPQFQLIVRRPTDLCVVLCQSLPDFAMNNQPHPVACYIVKDAGRPPKDGIRVSAGPQRVHGLTEADIVGERDPVTGKLLSGPYAEAPEPLPGEATDAKKLLAMSQEAQRNAILFGLGKETGLAADHTAVAAKRVYALTNTNVVVSGGNPIRQREIRVYATLPPGAYTILVACYQKLMEGPFTLTVYSNYRVHTSGLWPPSATATPAPISRVGKLINSGKAYVERLKKRVLKKQDDHAAALAKLEEEKEADLALAAMKEAALEAEAAAATMKLKPVTAWVEQWDPVQQLAYYVNVETGESQWDMPMELKPGMEGVAEYQKAMADKALSEKKLATGSPKKTKKKTKPVCSICQSETVKGTKEPSIPLWCAPGHTPSDLMKCGNGCGAFAHPVCAGYSDTKPPPDTWVCPVCKVDDDDGVE